MAVINNRHTTEPFNHHEPPHITLGPLMRALNNSRHHISRCKLMKLKRIQLSGLVTLAHALVLLRKDIIWKDSASTPSAPLPQRWGNQ
jgi:hypothetical protein